jgi:hypothetical protein
MRVVEEDLPLVIRRCSLGLLARADGEEDGRIDGAEDRRGLSLAAAGGDPLDQRLFAGKVEHHLARLAFRDGPDDG